MFFSYTSISSVTQLCLTLCNPMDCSTPGFPVLHYLPELAQTHVHWVGDAIQPSHPLLSRSPPAFSLPQDQGLFQWVSSSHHVAKVLELLMNILIFWWISVPLMNIQGWFPLRLTGLISLQIKGHSRDFSGTTVQKHQFFSTQPSLWSSSHIPYMTTRKPRAVTIQTFVRKVMSLLCEQSDDALHIHTYNKV